MAREEILVADDEPDILDLARFILETQGYRVTTVSDGLQAVEKARQGTFDLFLTDVKMPGLDGLDAFRAIRQLDPSLLGVTMTGYGTMQIAVQALKGGFSDFLIKPFEPDDLLHAINRSLENERLRRENLRLQALIPLFELSHLLMTETVLSTLFEKVVATAQRETAAASARLLLRQEGGTFESVAGAGRQEGGAAFTQSMAAAALTRRRPLLLNGATPDGSLLALPLFVKEWDIGLLLLHKDAGEAPFEEGDAELLSVLAGQVAVAIENARLFEEREAAHRELEHIDRLKSEFINIAAHELRTPLSLVIGYAGLLEEEVDGVAREYAHSIAHNAVRLQGIVDDLTNLRHLETHEDPLQLVSANLADVVHRTIMLVDPPLTYQAGRAEVLLPGPLDPCWLDRRKIELALTNLLANAYKFSPPDGRVWVGVKAQGDEVHLWVRDEGPGIPPEEQANIWKRFYQVEESLTRVHGGIGLGLSIVKGVVEMHGGRVWVESAPGYGSTFYFSLPRRGQHE